MYSLLSDPNYSYALSWDVASKGFIIHNIGFFESNVMRKHFRNTSIASFFRQLNLYGFKRTSDSRKFRGRGRDSWCRFQHDHFSPGNINDLSLIKRTYTKKKPKGTPIQHNLSPKQPEIENYQLLDLYNCDQRVHSIQSSLIPTPFPYIYPIWVPTYQYFSNLYHPHLKLDLPLDFSNFIQ
ncbi:stress-responsive transcription factor hsf1 [Massospora cicadina]|nr:stress-responsive transcription factor hsf1 [Massospora cicadina]